MGSKGTKLAESERGVWFSWKRYGMCTPHSIEGASSFFSGGGKRFCPQILEPRIRHDNENCSPGYPHASALFFDVGTDSGLVSHNVFTTRCTAFVGYSASGVLLEDNSFQVRACHPRHMKRIGCISLPCPERVQRTLSSLMTSIHMGC